jgi:hypothetical protein
MLSVRMRLLRTVCLKGIYCIPSISHYFRTAVRECECHCVKSIPGLHFLFRERQRGGA